MQFQSKSQQVLLWISDYKVYMEKQMTQNSQPNSEGEQSQKTNSSKYQVIKLQ